MTTQTATAQQVAAAQFISTRIEGEFTEYPYSEKLLQQLQKQEQAYIEAQMLGDRLVILDYAIQVY